MARDLQGLHLHKYALRPLGPGHAGSLNEVNGSWAVGFLPENRGMSLTSKVPANPKNTSMYAKCWRCKNAPRLSWSLVMVCYRFHRTCRGHANQATIRCCFLMLR